MKPIGIVTAGALRKDGMVILENAFEHLGKSLARPYALFNWNRGNVQRDPLQRERVAFRPLAFPGFRT